METNITIDPLVRVEGHLKVECVVDDGEVKTAECSGPMFRGFERLLIGRDPLDAQQITQRVCGVCPAVHAAASALALDEALGTNTSIPPNGRIARNILLGANFLQSHILHFYHLAALDYVDCTKVADYDGPDRELQSLKLFIDRGELAPFSPRYEGDYRLPDEVDRAAAGHYLQALHMRRKSHEVLATFGGKMPHMVGMVPGGITEQVTSDKVADALSRLNEIRAFIDGVMVPDVVAIGRAYKDYFGIGRGPANFLSYGAFDLDSSEPDLAKRQRYIPAGTASGTDDLGALDPARIREDVKHSHFADSTSGRHPSEGQTEPDMASGHSWIKAPRYDGKAHQVGPLARAVVSLLSGHEPTKSLFEPVMSELGLKADDLVSTMGRHAARVLETKMVADAMAEWLLELKPGEPAAVPFERPEEASGMGIVGGPRGALLHYIDVKGGKIARYQMVVPTTWNCSPKDDRDQPGPAETALIGTKVRDAENPLEVVRIVRSFDPCLACAVHVVNVRREPVARIRVC
jgi:hydrogenase large subunit